MGNRKVLEAIDRTMQDIRRDNEVMNKVFFCGDFRQTPPIVIKGNRDIEVNASLKRFFLGFKIQRLRYKIMTC